MNARCLRSGVSPAAVLTVLLLSTGSAARADIPLPAGQLLLDLGSADAWRYGDLRQQLATPKAKNDCTLLPYPASGPDQLVTVTSSGAGPGFLDKNGKELLGIKGPGVDCGRVNQGQYLDIALAGTLTGKMFLSANLKLNVKSNAVIRATAYNDGAGSQQVFHLYSGRSIPAVLNPATDAVCAPGADSDPDNDATNCEWLIPGAGNRLRLHMEVGQAGIGGENSVSVFEIGTLVPKTGEIDCGDTTVQIDYLNTDEGANAAVQCTRLENVDASSCEVVDYSLVASCEGGECATRFLHAAEADDPLNTTKFSFICETWWPTQAGSFVGGELQLEKSKQYFGPNDIQGDDLDFCAGVTPVFSSTSAACTFESGGSVGGCGLDDIDSVQVPLALDHQSTLPGQQVGCLLDERVRQVEDLETSVIDSLIKQYQMWYLQGDYRLSRNY